MLGIGAISSVPRRNEGSEVKIRRTFAAFAPPREIPSSSQYISKCTVTDVSVRLRFSARARKTAPGGGRAPHLPSLLAIPRNERLPPCPVSAKHRLTHTVSVHLRFSGVTLALFRRSAGEEFSRWLKKFPALACLCAVLLFCGWPFNTHGELTGELGAFQDQCLVLMKRGNPPEAVSVAEKFVARAIELHGENHDATATAIGWVAYFSQLSADLERSEQLWRRALAIDEKLHGKDALETTSRLNMLAGLYQQKGDFIRAEEFLLRALKIREQHLDKNDPLLANTLWGLGRLANACGNFSKAEQYLTRAAVIYEKAVETDAHVALYATAGLNSLTGVYLDIGDLEKAEDYANRAVRIGEKNPAGALGPLSASYRLLGEISWKRGDIFQAERWLRKGLESYETLVGTNLDGEIQTRRLELGQFYLEQGNLEQAETVMRPVLSTAAENLPGNRDQKWSVLQCLAAWYEQQGEYDQAKTLARQNFDLVKDLAQIAPDVYSGPLKNLAEIELGLGNPNGAVAFANQIQDAEERKLGEVFSFSNERQRLSYQARGSDKGLDLWARAGAVQPLCRAVLRRKGLVLDSLLEDRRSVEKSDDPRARELLEQVRIARERVTGLQTALTHDSVHTNLVAYWARELEKAHSEAEVAENELARRVTGLGRVRRALKVTVEEIQQAIPQAAVVVELFRYRHYQGKSVWLDSYGALVLPHSGEPRFVPLGAAEPIEQNIKRYHYSMREGLAMLAVSEACWTL